MIQQELVRARQDDLQRAAAADRLARRVRTAARRRRAAEGPQPAAHFPRPAAATVRRWAIRLASREA
jgi:hypothetical protein